MCCKQWEKNNENKHRKLFNICICFFAYLSFFCVPETEHSKLYLYKEKTGIRLGVVKVKEYGDGRDLWPHSDRKCSELRLRGDARPSYKSPPFFVHGCFLFHVRGCLPACMTLHHVCSACRGQKKTSDFLELELRTVVRCRVGARNQTPALYESSWCS